MTARGLIVGVSLCIAICTLVGCAGSSSAASGVAALVADGQGCVMTVRGREAQIRPETSRLSCLDIRGLVTSLPVHPGRFSIVGGEPRVLWNCRYFGVRAGLIVLRCNHHRSLHFSLRK